MAQAYEFALNNMGMDFASSTIYNDYIMFVKNFDAAGSSYAENQKISAIRRIYHRGVIIPMLNVENLWYENEFNLKSITTATLKSLPFTFYSFLRLIAFDTKRFVSLFFLHFRIRCWIDYIGVGSCDIR